MNKNLKLQCFSIFRALCSSLSEDYTNDGHKDPDHKHETLGWPIPIQKSVKINHGWFFLAFCPLFFSALYVVNIFLIFCLLPHTLWAILNFKKVKKIFVIFWLSKWAIIIATFWFKLTPHLVLVQIVTKSVKLFHKANSLTDNTTFWNEFGAMCISKHRVCHQTFCREVRRFLMLLMMMQPSSWEKRNNNFSHRKFYWLSFFKTSEK